MSVVELFGRVERIYASVDVIQEFDMTKLPALVRQEKDNTSVFQDFTGGLSAAEIENIANLEDHLLGWARSNGKDTRKIDEVVFGTDYLKLVKDLSNNDKHGYPPRDGGHSGVAPKVLGIRRVMRLSTGGVSGSSVAMTLGPNGVPSLMSRGFGSGRALITGDVVDKDGTRIGDLYELQLEAMAAWENLMEELGIN